MMDAAGAGDLERVRILVIQGTDKEVAGNTSLHCLTLR